MINSLMSAREELERVEKEQRDKVSAANAAFDADPNESTAEALSMAERICERIIANARKKLKDIETKAREMENEQYRCEIGEIEVKQRAFEVQLAERIEEVLRLRRELRKLELDRSSFGDFCELEMRRAALQNLIQHGYEFRDDQERNRVAMGVWDGRISEFRNKLQSAFESRLDAFDASIVPRPQSTAEPQPKPVTKRQSRFAD